MALYQYSCKQKCRSSTQVEKMDAQLQSLRAKLSAVDMLASNGMHVAPQGSRNICKASTTWTIRRDWRWGKPIGSRKNGCRSLNEHAQGSARRRCGSRHGRSPACSGNEDLQVVDPEAVDAFAPCRVQPQTSPKKKKVWKAE